jgi:hypothetical protein
MSNIVRSEANIDICTKTLMEKFHVTAERGDAIDLSTWVQWYVSFQHYSICINTASNTRTYHANMFQVRI